MAEESSAKLSEQFKALVAQYEGQTKAIQDQIASQWQCQRSRNSPGLRGCPSRNSPPSVT
jgi:hypothetical protein